MVFVLTWSFFTDLLNAPRPANVSAVRSLLGMANYSSQYISNFVVDASLVELSAILSEKTPGHENHKVPAVLDRSWKTLFSKLRRRHCPQSGQWSTFTYFCRVVNFAWLLTINRWKLYMGKEPRRPLFAQKGGFYDYSHIISEMCIKQALRTLMITCPECTQTRDKDGYRGKYQGKMILISILIIELQCKFILNHVIHHR